MPIVVNLDVMMARRHKGAGELAEEIGITPANLSILTVVSVPSGTATITVTTEDGSPV